jgi:hypothetical protein
MPLMTIPTLALRCFMVSSSRLRVQGFAVVLRHSPQYDEWYEARLLL